MYHTCSEVIPVISFVKGLIGKAISLNNTFFHKGKAPIKIQISSSTITSSYRVCIYVCMYTCSYVFVVLFIYLKLSYRYTLIFT